MFFRLRPKPKNEPTRKGSQLESEITIIEDSRAGEGTTRTSTSSPTFSIVRRKEVKPIVIEGQYLIWTVACLVDGKCIVSGGHEETIRRWRVADGEEVGPPMCARGTIWHIAVSQDGQWIVSGTTHGQVEVWNAETQKKATEFTAHGDSDVRVVDISPEGRRIATGSDDCTVCIWSLSTRQRLLRPLQHRSKMAAVKFSPDGCLIATATWQRDSVRVYDSRNGSLQVDAPIIVNSTRNCSLAWASDSKRLFALSREGEIHCLDGLTGVPLSTWNIHDNKDAMCIALASNGMFAAASAGPSVSFWDILTHEQIGSAINHAHDVETMAISENLDLVAGGDNAITLRSLWDTLPPSYLVDDVGETIQKLRSQLAESMEAQQKREDIIQSLCSREEKSSSSIMRLEETSQSLRDELTQTQQTADKLRSQHTTANEQIGHLEEVVLQLRTELATSQRTADQKKDDFCRTIDDLRGRAENSGNRIVLLERANQQLQRSVDSLRQIIRMHEQKHQCESMYAQGRIYDTADSLLNMMNGVTEDINANKFLRDWLAEFISRCVKTLEKIGDEASNNKRPEEAIAAYSALLSLTPSSANNVLTKWANMILCDGSVGKALASAAKFKLPMFVVYRTICDVLEGTDRIQEAAECFRGMQQGLSDEAGIHDERMQWESDFRGRCAGKLERLGDAAMDSQEHDEAIRYYSDALSLDPVNFNDILLKRSSEYIKLNPSSYKGYGDKHAALHGLGRYGEAFGAHKMMLLTIEQSLEPKICELRHQYVDSTCAIQNIVTNTVRHMPRELIDTVTGRLCDKTQQAKAFEELPIYHELRSSMTTQTLLDCSRIQREVEHFYRYVMFSHKWQFNEPTLQQVENISVYDLPESTSFDKLRNFCKLACSLHFKWAWSDTCCINQLDKGAQQESIIAMFRWYHGSSLTVVHLLGVLSESQVVGCLRRSIWNTRGWTYQEYIASQVIQFYTEDWKPYLDLQIYNHKESPLILSEMEQAVNLATKELTSLQPGLDRAREKLYLASARHTTREEDVAYSLFGIFNLALPIIYGEGNQAVGRLLERILARSVDVTLLAWTGRSGDHYSYLPVDLTVYNQIVAPHLPPPLEPAVMDGMAAALRPSSLDLSLAVDLYNRLHDLPPLSLVSGRLKLPGIVFPLSHPVPLSDSESDAARVYRATTPMIGDVEIHTMADLSGTSGLLLIHPWISPLVDRDFSCGVAKFDLVTCSMRLVVRLRQPFGALLLAPTTRSQHRRVAADSLIMVRVREETTLRELMEGVRMVDVQ